MLTIELIQSTRDVYQAYEIEKNAYTSEAAASLEAFFFRQMHFNNYFFIAKHHNVVVGLTNGVRLNSCDLADEGIKQMASSTVEGRFFCVLTVAVEEQHRGKGYAFALISRVLEQARADELEGVVLMCEQPLIPFYEKLGFHYIKPSSSVHGGIQWHEMMMHL